MLFFGVCFLLSYLKLSAGNELGLLILKLPFTLSHMLEQIVISLSCIFGNWSLWRPAWPALRGSFDKKKKKKKKKKISYNAAPCLYLFHSKNCLRSSNSGISLHCNIWTTIPFHVDVKWNRAKISELQRFLSESFRFKSRYLLSDKTKKAAKINKEGCLKSGWEIKIKVYPLWAKVSYK